MEDLSEMCKIKLMVNAAYSLEQGLYYCHQVCNGFKKDCPYYSTLTKKDLKNYKELASYNK